MGASASSRGTPHLQAGGVRIPRLSPRARLGPLRARSSWPAWTPSGRPSIPPCGHTGSGFGQAGRRVLLETVSPGWCSHRTDGEEAADTLSNPPPPSVGSCRGPEVSAEQLVRFKFCCGVSRQWLCSSACVFPSGNGVGRVFQTKCQLWGQVRHWLADSRTTGPQGRGQPHVPGGRWGGGVGRGWTLP